MQQLTAAKKLAFPSSQRAAVEQLIEKRIPILRSASRAGRGRADRRLEARRADAPSTKRRRVESTQVPPTQPSSARPRQAPPPRAGREKAAREATRVPPLDRTATPAPLPPPTPAAQGLPERAPPAPGSSPATNKDSSTTSTAMVPRRQQQCRATPNGPTRQERPPQHQGVTRSSSSRLPETAPSSPPLGQLPPSTPIASYAAAGGRGVARATSAWWAEPN